MFNYFAYNTKLGKLFIEADGEFVTAIAFGTANFRGDFRASSATNNAAKELVEYLFEHRRDFSFKYKQSGSKFQMEVWSEIEKIPYGQTITYQDIATKIGRPKAFRAVGTACGKNKLPIVIPCHRVVPSSGSVGSYAFGTKIKQYLLNIEKP